MSQSLSLHHITKPAVTTKEKPAALFMFHGYGSNENDLFSFASELPEELFIISVRAPQPMQPQGNSWYTIHWDGPDGKFNDAQEAIASRDLIAKFVHEATEAYNLDARNITLHLNIFISHGSVDQVIPLEWAQKTPAFLEKIGIESKLHEYPVGHGVAPQNFYDLKEWLMERM